MKWERKRKWKKGKKQLAKESYNYGNLLCNIERTETSGGNKVLRLFKQIRIGFTYRLWLCIHESDLRMTMSPLCIATMKNSMYICRWCEIMAKLVRNRKSLLIGIAQIIMIWLYSQRVSIIRYIRYCLWSVKS